jgi:hypothetical protein
MKRYLNTVPAIMKNAAPNPVMMGEMTMYASTTVSGIKSNSLITA